MILYQTMKNEKSCGFDLTTADARKRAKFEKFRDALNEDVYVDQLDFKPTRKNVCDLLNGEDVITELKPVRTWITTNRGGLKEVK